MLSTSTPQLDRLLRERTAFSLPDVVQRATASSHDIVIWTGSLLEGFGNSTSDIDFYVIVDDVAGRPGVFVPLSNGRGYRSETIGGKTRIDLNFIATQTLNDLIAQLTAFEEYDADRVQLDPEGLEILHRMTFGIQIAGCEELTLRPDKQLLSNYIAAVMIERANSYKQDSIGSLLDGDPESAIVSDRMRLRCLIDAFLARNGLTNARFDHWRIKKLAQLGEPDFLHRYLACEGIPGPRRTAGEHASAVEHLSVIRDLCRDLEDSVL